MLPLLVACAAPPVEPLLCNGRAELCDRRLDQVVFPATHNAMSNEMDGFSLPNQPTDVATQLDDGARGFLLDTYRWEDDLYLCHGYCELGATPLADTLAVYRGFLDAHPGEVLHLVLQDAISAEETAGAFAAAGLDGRAWAWDGGALPTLGELVAADTRLVVSAEVAGPPPDWYHHAWDLYGDTPYDFDSVDAFTCDPNRGDPSNPLFLLNHWVEDPFPDPELAAAANAFDVLDGRARACADAWGRLPTLVAVDWYTAGDLFAVVDGLNG